MDPALVARHLYMVEPGNGDSTLHNTGPVCTHSTIICIKSWGHILITSLRSVQALSQLANKQQMLFNPQDIAVSESHFEAEDKKFKKYVMPL